jgi:hypothetical protein
MMYGSSTIPKNNKCAVEDAEKRHKSMKWFGPGALFVSCDLRRVLGSELALISVMALDCSSRAAVNIDAVEEHQRTWWRQEWIVM